MTSSRNKERFIAAAVTIVAALLIFIFLYFGALHFDRALLAASSIPEEAQEEDIYIYPELIDPGEDESPQQVSPQAEALGSPEVVEEPKPQTPVVKGENPKPAPQKEKLVTSRKPEEVKSSEPKTTEKEKRKAQGKVANAFRNSGNASGRADASGAGGSSVGISGNTNGWKFLGCPSPKVALRNKTTIRVAITVNAEGKVTKARASGGDAAARAACEQAALGASWQPISNKSAKTASGTITFTITPK